MNIVILWYTNNNYVDDKEEWTQQVIQNKLGAIVMILLHAKHTPSIFIVFLFQSLITK